MPDGLIKTILNKAYTRNYLKEWYNIWRGIGTILPVKDTMLKSLSCKSNYLEFSVEVWKETYKRWAVEAR